jgi:hypothetical protein
MTVRVPLADQLLLDSSQISLHQLHAIMDSQVLLSRRLNVIRPPGVHTPFSQELPHEQENSRISTKAMLPEQSLSLVEIFLNAAIASVLYTRQLLKHDSPVFSQRCVADLLDSPSSRSYRDFLDQSTHAGETRSQVFKILRKGRSRRADRLLTLLVCVHLICKIRLTDHEYRRVEYSMLWRRVT